MMRYVISIHMEVIMKKILIATAISFALFFAVAEKSEANTCYAYTPCQNGFAVQCTTYGQGCSWYVQPYQYVQCTGFDAWGNWVNLYFRCY
ncbi:MAG: hypothetical protein A2583_05040 [Bdellovibrionales bacterium RIFOXYD1_FULL_53_11]|nr:MAG: hypothetical protein A2583_05040 [Bdellovibrionales bacterium RIFOXYD1_FULL_53_11]